MADSRPWPRRIVICCDGTWQSSVSLRDNVPSNVTKLCRHIARMGSDSTDSSKKFHQLVYYDSGIGTGNLSSVEAKRQGGTGAGLTENVAEAYNFIVLNYQPGDEIFCFGFSRGAYTARAVAGLVTDIGVIEPRYMQLFPEIYRAYMQNEEGEDFRQSKAWLEFVNGKLSKKGKELEKRGGRWSEREQIEGWEIRPHGELAVSEESRKVKVVGVWDTVGSLGIPDVAWFDNANFRVKFGFHNVKLSDNIEHAYHALALDERRGAFRPTLWWTKKTSPTELKQVWFPGVHINCGGGSDDAITEMKGDIENLSNATVAWMLQCIAPHLTLDRGAFNQSMAQYQRWLNHIRFACTYHHEGWIDWAKNKIPNIPFINPAEDELTPPKRDPPHEHLGFDYGWGTGPIVDSYTGLYKLQSAEPRIPGKTKAEVYDKAAKAYKLEPMANHGLTYEYIHPICHYRKVIRNDTNSALKGWERRHKKTSGDKGRYWWYNGKDDKDPLPEWVILKDDHMGQDDPNAGINFERYWYNFTEKPDEHLEKLKGLGYKKDYLVSLDEATDFEVAVKEGGGYPTKPSA
ncbi:hypothetical protein P154DRAFT_547308 [Amniculicola lignicola CBS 123094]|uniref:T6SS Phospholipase effector Tle1-like catalytic domain-containing protein n=1 Tax=Amniculicola lignicola CBS 123094 TaxID=1392246 RepID=A0A6A5W6U4_9PLEO|nr:hypothetical protein P154DRAFT_547308 [Amniculicola lignicola CBS 123094]